jgi:hypothetical protein
MALRATVTRSRALRQQARATRETSARLRHVAVSVRRRIYRVITGGSDAPVTDDEVRALLRALFDSGVLPREVIRTVFAGRSQGRGRCVACDVPFRLGEIEYEVDIGKAPLPVASPVPGIVG